MRYYYKDANGNYYSYKSECSDLIPITEQEFNQATIPQLTAEQIALQNKQDIITQKKVLLNKYKEDVEQVDLFGMERSDYAEKKQLCAQLVIELRELERGE